MPSRVISSMTCRRNQSNKKIYGGTATHINESIPFIFHFSRKVDGKLMFYYILFFVIVVYMKIFY